MNEIEEAIKRNEEIRQQAEALLQQADAALRERDRIFEDCGIPRQSFMRFLESEHVSPEDRARIQAEFTKQKEEMEAEERRIADQQNSVLMATRVKKPSMNRLV